VGRAERHEQKAELLLCIERRLDAAQSTFSDTVRHVAERIAEFDPQIGDSAVLSRWLRVERDQFELRRQSLSEWVLVSATAQLTVLNELTYERMSEPGDETEAKISRVVGTLRSLSTGAQMGWAKLRGNDPELLNLEELTEASAQQKPAQLIIEYWQEVLTHHKQGLAEVAKQWGADISKAMSGLTCSEVFH